MCHRLVLLSLLAPILVAAAPAPRDISDFYELLAQKHEVDAVLYKQAGKWKYMGAFDGEQLETQGEPLVDAKNGYMAMGYAWGPCAHSVDIALFMAKGGRRFIAVAGKHECSEGDGTSIRAYEFTGASFKDAIETVGVLGTLKMADFLDEKYVKSKAAADDRLAELSELALIEYELPRVGTTVVVRLVMPESQPTGVDLDVFKAAQRVVRIHRKYNAIELSWSADEAKFSISKKR